MLKARKVYNYIMISIEDLQVEAIPLVRSLKMVTDKTDLKGSP